MDRYQRDVQWLGEEEASLGPAARAALGILIEKDDWSWWDAPHKTLASLERSVPRQSPITWGGDSSVMDSDQWVDPQRAIILGHAFYELMSQTPLKIKVARMVWSWPEGAQTISQVILEMSRLVGPGHVFPEWERNTKPRFPVIPRSPRELTIITSPNFFPDELVEAWQQYIEWRRDTRVADIIVADSIDALNAIDAARLVILYGRDIETKLSQVSRIRDRLCAQCVIHVDTDEKITSWLAPMFNVWAELARPLADAIETAQHHTGLRTLVLSTTQSFLLGRGTFLGMTSTVKTRQITDDYYLAEKQPSGVADFSFPDSELTDQSGTDESKSIAVVNAPLIPGETRKTALPRSDDSAIFRKASLPIHIARSTPPIERVLNARARQGLQDVEVWPNYGVVEIDIDIRVKSPLRDRDDRPAFPDDRVEWDGDRKFLQVHMFEVGRKPESRELELSRTGDSTIARFFHECGADSIDLRFLVSDGARILQTARFQTAPGEQIRFFIENIVTPVHRSKLAFDAALLMNDSLGNQPSVAIINGEGEVVFSPLSENGIGWARDELLLILEQAVVNPSASLSHVMLELANSGTMLQSYLRSIVPTWPGSEGRIQLVTQSEVFFPIEYLYDGKIPESPSAQLCTESRNCLKQGKAIKNCPIREAGEQLCPMGFLGVSGIVERHTWKAGQDPRIWGGAGEYKQKRHRIEDLSAIAFAASDKADDFEDTDLKPHEIVRIASIEESLGVKKISNWSVWKERLAQHPPSMLLWLVHMEKKAVYVGVNSGLNLGAIDIQHVKNAPVVIAIGCSTGLGEVPGSSLPAILQIKGARVVVAAMTGVLGRHANRAARDLAIRLKEAAIARRSVFIGEIITTIRRQLLADGLALGLTVIAFGDADIVLGKE